MGILAHGNRDYTTRLAVTKTNPGVISTHAQDMSVRWQRRAARKAKRGTGSCLGFETSSLAAMSI